MKSISIYEATTATDYQDSLTYIQSYSKFLGIDLSYQNFDEEIANLATMYAPPKGCMILAKVGKDLAGGIGLRDLGRGVGEMKRLYVYPEFQGMKIAKKLVIYFLEKAKELGYKKIRLDTLPRLEAAYHLYKKFGFYEIPAYRYNPDPKTIFMEHIIH